MSHFSVAVFSKHPDDVERLLAPYDENIEVAPYVEYPASEAAEHVKYWNDDMIDSEGNLLTTYNPNSKWDWYQIGGRFSDSLRRKDGTKCDYASVKDVDFSPDKEVYADCIDFWERYVEGRDRADNGGRFDRDDFRTFYKPEYYSKRYGTKENFAESEASQRTYAFVDALGVWHETGQMGWWGIDHTTKEGIDGYKLAFDRYVLEACEKDLYITIVDCHI